MPGVEKTSPQLIREKCPYLLSGVGGCRRRRNRCVGRTPRGGLGFVLVAASQQRPHYEAQ